MLWYSSHSPRIDITGTDSIWLIARRRGRERTEKVSSSGVSRKMRNNKEEEEYHFTPRKVLIYCLIVGLINAYSPFS